MQDEITKAIKSLRRLLIWYEPGKRVIEPHALGLSKDGFPLLRAYQTQGASASGEHEWWKLFRVDRIDSLSITDETFDGPRPLYNPADKAMKGGIIAAI